jgi:hypothetical protein
VQIGWKHSRSDSFCDWLMKLDIYTYCLLRNALTEITGVLFLLPDKFSSYFSLFFFASQNTQLISFTYMISERHAGIFLQLLKVLKRLSNDAITSKFRDSSESDDPSEHQRSRSSILKKIKTAKIMIFYYLWCIFLFYFIVIAQVSMLSVYYGR